MGNRPDGAGKGEGSTAEPSAAQRAQIDAILALDVAREDALIRERALEIARDCAQLPPEVMVPAFAAEVVALTDAFEGYASPERAGEADTGHATAAAVGRAGLVLAARITRG